MGRCPGCFDALIRYQPASFNHAAFSHPGGFGPRIAAGDDIFDVYNLCGPWNVNDGSLYFGDNDNFRGLVWHEFSHSYVNYLTDRYIGFLSGAGQGIRGRGGEKGEVAGSSCSAHDSRC